jgi:hypothetical protein
MVLPQLLRVVGSSKLLFVPATVFLLSGGGIALVSYKSSRYISSKLLQVNPDNTQTTTSSICINASSLLAAVPVIAFLFNRHRRFNPPTFAQSWQSIREQVINKTFTVNHIQNEFQTHSTTTPTGVKTMIQPLSRTEALKNIISRPIRFYGYNLFMGATILGSFTSINQRLICGKSKPIQVKKVVVEK